MADSAHERSEPASGGEGFDDDSEEAWDERYRSEASLWSGRPNEQLVAEAASLAPGTALEVGCGEGADAMWLAERGWKVWALDISSVALSRGRHAAAARSDEVAGRIRWVQADVTAAALPEGPFDLVCAQYLHLPPDRRHPLWDRLAAAVAPGGSLLVVAHDPSDLQVSEHRHHHPERFFSSEDVVARLPGADWTIVTDRVGTHAPTGEDRPVRDLVVRAVRRAVGVPA